MVSNKTLLLLVVVLGVLMGAVDSTAVSLTIPRYVAFQVFLGTSDLIGGVAGKFINGLHSAFLVSVGVLVVALVLSAVRGKEVRATLVDVVKRTNR